MEDAKIKKENNNQTNKKTPLGLERIYDFYGKTQKNNRTDRE